MKIKKYIFILIGFCCLIVMIYSAFKIKYNIEEYKAGERLYNDLKIISQTDYPQNNEKKEDGDIDKINEIDFNELKNINSEIIAWIKDFDGTINYPIAQGKDNNYYLNHLFNKEKNSSGCIFLDYRNKKDFSDKNSIIYGHNMNDGSMFASLLNYQEEKYFIERNKLSLITPEKNYVIQIFSCYNAEINGNSWNMDFQLNSDYENWLKEITQKSLWDSSVLPSKEDKIVTLSTCTNDSQNLRFVIHGILYES